MLLYSFIRAACVVHHPGGTWVTVLSTELEFGHFALDGVVCLDSVFTPAVFSLEKWVWLFHVKHGIISPSRESRKKYPSTIFVTDSLA